MKNKGQFATILLSWLVIMLISAIIGGFLWTYSINTWLTFFHKPTQISYWQGMIIGFVPGIGPMSLVVGFVTWLLMLFIGGA